MERRSSAFICMLENPLVTTWPRIDNEATYLAAGKVTN